MPKGDAKEGYLNTNAHLETKVAMLERDLAEQCRLLGMGSEREARLMAQLAESQARELRLREACAQAAKWLSPTYEGSHEARRLCYAAIAIPQDDSALREMIEAAKAEEREALSALARDAERFLWLRDNSEPADWEMLGYQDAVTIDHEIDAAIRARNPEKPSGLSERVMTVFAQMQAVSHGRARKG